MASPDWIGGARLLPGAQQDTHTTAQLAIPFENPSVGAELGAFQPKFLQDPARRPQPELPASFKGEEENLDLRWQMSPGDIQRVFWELSRVFCPDWELRWRCGMFGVAAVSPGSCSVPPSRSRCPLCAEQPFIITLMGLPRVQPSPPSIPTHPLLPELSLSLG